jgi:glyoxylase-like metal-dependent hydrolase (beta-lactamase superfamily II)
VRAVALHRDAVVVTSRLWQTTATALRSGESCFVIDSPYFPDELDTLSALLDQAGFRPEGLLATHADWDHLLGRLAFPGMALGVGVATAERLAASPGTAQRELRGQDEELYVVRERPLSLGQVQALPVPGKLDLGERELELHDASGHTADGMAVVDREAGVLVAGDYLSEVEIPSLGPGGALSAYRETLGRFDGLIREGMTVVPGHGAPLEASDAARVLEEDVAYLDALSEGSERPKLPSGRDTPRQRAVHAGNLACRND